jgi:very-short-patch-repair endonuclease
MGEGREQYQAIRAKAETRARFGREPPLVALRNRQFHGWKFRRQVPIKRHIADFVCIDAKLTIEVDGGQHSENTARDAARSAELERSGFVVIRLWNEDVLKNIDDVLDEIYRMLHPTEMRPSP